MKLIRDLLVAVLFFLVIGIMVDQKVNAQAAQAVSLEGGAASSTCLTPVAGQTILCIGTDDIKGSWNGAAYVSLKPNPVAAGVSSIAINGVTKTGAAIFTITGASGITAQ